MMQLVWKYIDDIAGKGIEWYYIVELIFYWSAGVVPIALPIAILLSSLMTIGNFGENYELAAMKSAGISLFRIMRPMFILLMFIAVGAFYFSNNVIPVANLKAMNLIRNMSKQKPAFNIIPGSFYSGIQDFSIKVGSKEGENDEILKNIIIYDHTDQRGNNKVTVAKEGKMNIVGDEEYLELVLKDGYTYEDVYNKNRKERNRRPFIKAKFQKSIVRFSLKEFKSGDLRESNMKNFYMLNIDQLMDEADSTLKNKEKGMTQFSNAFVEKYSFRKAHADSAKNYERISPDEFIYGLENNYQKRAIQNALRTARSNREYIINQSKVAKYKDEMYVRHFLEWHKKFSLSISCIILFFIGAPLGAIIRKGGLGMPVIVSVSIFIIFHILNITFEKMGRQLTLEPWFAIWLPSLILTPIGIFLTQRAATDSGLMSAEGWSKFFSPITSLFKRKKK